MLQGRTISVVSPMTNLQALADNKKMRLSQNRDNGSVLMGLLHFIFIYHLLPSFFLRENRLNCP